MREFRRCATVSGVELWLDMRAAPRNPPRRSRSADLRPRAAFLLLGVLLSACLGGCQWMRGGPPPSVILIVVDTLRADHLGVYGYARPTSPALARWAGKGVVFEQAHAPSPWTLPSFGSLYTGQQPSRHRAGATISGKAEGESGRVIGEQRVFSGLEAKMPTLAELLRDQGYETGAIVNNIYLHPAFGVARGFQDYDYVPGHDDDFRRANVVVDRAFAWMESRSEKPFFLVLHLMDPHMNYNAPPPYRGRFTGSYQSRYSLPLTDTGGIRRQAATMPQVDRDFITAAYDEEVAFADEHIGRLLDGLEQRGLLKNTVVLLTADHGEELFDHGGFTHGHTMYEELLHVPLIVWAPEAPARRVQEPVSLVDVTPTILDAIGARPKAEFEGVSLWPAIRHQSAVPSRVLAAEYTCIGPERKAIIEWPYKLVYTDDGEPLQLIDLTKAPEVALPPDAEPELGRRLLAQLKKTFPAEGAQGEAQAVQLDAETRERLRALGYTD